MLSESYLEKGITALSRAGEKAPMAGHTGAAVIAAYFFCQNTRLDAATQSMIRKHVDALIEASGKGWYPGSENPEERGALFKPHPAAPSDLHLCQDILSVLDRKITRLRSSGHCTIFASLALKALKRMPSMATPSVVGGICRLIESFSDSPGQGYYGKEKGWIKGIPVAPEEHLPPYENLDSVVHAAFREVVTHDKIRRKGYGSLVHLMTHTNALLDLTEMGSGEMARKGYAAHQTHIMLLRSLPPDLDENDGVVFLKPNPHNPLTYDYWAGVDANQPSASALGLGGMDHILKVNYAFFNLIESVKTPDLQAQYMEHLGYLT
ncbi:MAG: hypothetical protein O7E52_22900 [Candidatus Poribacteria bacterium]|nr:hypothetical protein [Candidatus Poribacteria bacterium]